MSIDLNCDLGEGESPDQTRELMKWITSANVACGVHAGDEDSMRDCVLLAKNNDVKIGAHPGSVDRDGGGRTPFSLKTGELESLIGPQIDLLASIAGQHQESLHHIKLHGALYHAVESDRSSAEEFVQLVQTRWKELKIIGLAGGDVVKSAKKAGHPVWEEAFADRAYQRDGQLVPRAQPNAVLSNEHQIIDRVQRMIARGSISSHCGDTLEIQCDTICVHSDSPNALNVVRKLSGILQ